MRTFCSEDVSIVIFNACLSFHFDDRSFIVTDAVLCVRIEDAAWFCPEISFCCWFLGRNIRPTRMFRRKISVEISYNSIDISLARYDYFIAIYLISSFRDEN